ncbi:MAG: TonB-dependent receptor [Gemmatimonadetes bacterium]|nr:TonB-dependent receptor [Gemmatimonadota bacterium]
MTGIDAALTGGSNGRIEASYLTGFDHATSGGVFGGRVLREDGWRPNSGYSLGQGHARVVRDVGPGATLDAGVELYGARWDSPGFLTLDQYDRAKFDTVSNLTDGGFKRRAQERVSLRVIHGDRMLWRSTVYATQGRWQLFLTTPPEGGGGEGTGGQTEEEDSRYGFGATTAATWSYPRAEITVGAEGRWDHADFQNWFVTDRLRDSSQTLVGARQLGGGVFVQSVADVGRHIRLSLGGRYDLIGTGSTPEGSFTHTASKGILSPKLGGLLHLPHAFDLYANVSRGFRQTDGVIEDPTLPFITTWAYETGLKLDTRGVRASVALFRMDVSDEQSFDPVTLSSSSGGKSRRQGVEVDLQARLAPAWTLTTDVTFTDAKYQRLITEEGDTLSGARVYNTAKYAGSAGLAWGPAGSIFNGALSTNVVGPYAPFDEPGVTLDPYALLHANAGARVGRTLLQLGVRNLLDQKYPELRAGGFVVPGQPRTVYGTVRYLW